ncbi:MAG: MFS transporter [Beijerinckiaceae bacterium]
MSRARYSFAIPLIVGCSQFMHQFDGVAIATALPSMAREMGENPLHLNLAITAYLLTLAIFVPISSWLADRYGAKRVYLLAIAIFTTSSVLAGLSQTLEQLVAARICQGIGGAMMNPVGRAIVVRTAPRSDIVKAMTYITLPAAMAPLFGPSVGGFIVTYFSWHWIFFINLPIGLAGLALVMWKIPDVAREEPRPLDLIGFLLVATGVAFLMGAFSSMGRGILPIWAIVALLVAGLGCGIWYLRRAKNVPAPIVDLSLLKIGTFRASLGAGGLFYMGTTAFVFLLALLLQVGFGMSAFAAGATTLAGALGSLTTRFIIRKLIAMFGFRRLLLLNGTVMAVFLLICSQFTPSFPHLLILAILYIGGISRSTQFSAIQAMGYADMPRPLMSRATSFSAMAQQMAQSFGVGLAALVIHSSQLLRSAETVNTTDIAWGFFAIALAAIASLLLFVRLPADAGRALGPDAEDSGAIRK